MQPSGEDDASTGDSGASGREAFTRTGTLGIEEEFYVVDGAGYPTAGTDELVYQTDPPDVLKGRLDHELFKCVIETQTPVIESVSDVRDYVSRVRNAITTHAADYGYEIAGAGLHPAARWRELAHAEKPRYRSQLDRIQYPQHRNTTAGVHVHVGVDDADKATWIANTVRYYLPPILALSANSPFWNGYDTGLASARAKIFEALPNTGMPTSFADFDAYRQFEQRMLDTDSVRDRGELWYDVRPHTGHGTVEIRAPDGQRDLENVLGFVEYVHALVVDLAARYEDETNPHPPRTGDINGGGSGHLRRELLEENKWRAIRHGHEATFLTPDGSGNVALDEFVDRECDRLGVAGIRAILDRESGAARQRRVSRIEGFEQLRRDLLLP